MSRSYHPSGAALCSSSPRLCAASSPHARIAARAPPAPKPPAVPALPGGRGRSAWPEGGRPPVPLSAVSAGRVLPRPPCLAAACHRWHGASVRRGARRPRSPPASPLDQARPNPSPNPNPNPNPNPHQASLTDGLASTKSNVDAKSDDLREVEQKLSLNLALTLTLTRTRTLTPTLTRTPTLTPTRTRILTLTLTLSLSLSLKA